MSNVTSTPATGAGACIGVIVISSISILTCFCAMLVYAYRVLGEDRLAAVLQRIFVLNVVESINYVVSAIAVLTGIMPLFCGVSGFFIQLCFIPETMMELLLFLTIWDMCRKGDGKSAYITAELQSKYFKAALLFGMVSGIVPLVTDSVQYTAEMPWCWLSSSTPASLKFLFAIIWAVFALFGGALTTGMVVYRLCKRDRQELSATAQGGGTLLSQGNRTVEYGTGHSGIPVSKPEAVDGLREFAPRLAYFGWYFVIWVIIVLHRLCGIDSLVTTQALLEPSLSLANSLIFLFSERRQIKAWLVGNNACFPTSLGNAISAAVASMSTSPTTAKDTFPCATAAAIYGFDWCVLTACYAYLDISSFLSVGWFVSDVSLNFAVLAVASAERKWFALGAIVVFKALVVVGQKLPNQHESIIRKLRLICACVAMLAATAVRVFVSASFAADIATLIQVVAVAMLRCRQDIAPASVSVLPAVLCDCLVGLRTQNLEGEKETLQRARTRILVALILAYCVSLVVACLMSSFAARCMDLVAFSVLFLVFVVSEVRRQE